MGPLWVRRKRVKNYQMRLAADLIPRSAIPPMLVNPVGFDKARPSAVWRLTTVATDFAQFARRAQIPLQSKTKKSPTDTAGPLIFVSSVES
jgi:hypothetical protein